MTHTVDERVEFLESLLREDPTTLEKIGLQKKDLDAMAYLGRVAFESERYDQAVAIFSALEALQPYRARVLLFRAEAEKAAGRSAEAFATVTRFLARESPGLTGDYTRGLLLRACLWPEEDQGEAVHDLRAAQFLAQHDEEARQVLAEVGL